MTRMFDPNLLNSHDLFHVRYGRGAIIVAIRREPDETAKSKERGLDRHVWKRFNARGLHLHTPDPELDPVLSLAEEDGFVRVTIQYEHRSPIDPSYDRLSARIERVIPRQQVTLEIIRESERVELRRQRS